MLFAKTLVRKDVAGGAPPTASTEAGVTSAVPEKKAGEDEKEDEEDVTSKSQVLVLDSSVLLVERFKTDASFFTRF